VTIPRIQTAAERVNYVIHVSEGVHEKQEQNVYIFALKINELSEVIEEAHEKQK